VTTSVSTPAVAPGSTASHQQDIRTRIATLSYLPTTAAVALKFVELGKNPEAEPNDYARVISADSSLSSKLLALANSSWAGVRNRVTTVRMAVNLLGLGTVRTLAISYCMTGLHNELHLSPAESQAFWEAALCKAVAAKHYARLFDAKTADEAFVGGLFQDFALAVIYSVLREPYLALLHDPETNVQVQLQKERELVGMDHTEVGRTLAQRLELPEVYVDAIAFHHSYERLAEFVTVAPVRDATYAAGLLPHVFNRWNQADAQTLAEFLKTHAPATDTPTYLAQVQTEFAELYSFFHEGDVPQAQLAELVTQASREAADNTTALVGKVNDLLREAATMGTQMRTAVTNLENQASYDAITGALTRPAFASRAQDMLATAARYGTSLAAVYLDVDRFKAVNDEFGHAFGDQVLKAVAEAVKGALPPGALFGRLGGDELVILISGCSATEAKQVAARIVADVAAEPVQVGHRSRTATVSAGLLLVPPTEHLQVLDHLLDAADKLMYVAKRAGGNQAESRTV